MKRTLIATSMVLVASAVALFILWSRPLDADVRPNQQLTVNGDVRGYRIVIPHMLPKPAPVVFAFHGTGDSPESMADYSRVDWLASRHGLILIYPLARNSMWATIDATSDNLDANPDVQFFDQLLVHLQDNYDIDPDHAYAVGMSNGASFVQLLAIARPQRIAAVVAHSGSKPRGLDFSDHRLPIMLIVGGNDLAASAMRLDADQYRSAGHPVEYVEVPGLAHEWSTPQNTAIWDFISQHSLNRNP